MIYGPDKIFLMYPRTWSSDVAWLQYCYVGIHSVVVSFICPMCTINVGVSYLYFCCCVDVCPWYTCTGIASAFIYDSFCASMRAEMPCFPGTTIAHIISTSFHRLENCSTLWCLSPKTLHNFCILIGLQNLTEKCFPPIHIPKALLKNSSCDPEIAIYGPGPYRKYTRWTKLVDAIGLTNISTINPPVFPWALSTLVANDVSKLSMSNTYMGDFLPKFLLDVPWEIFLRQINPCPCHYHYILGLYAVLWYWGYVV